MVTLPVYDRTGAEVGKVDIDPAAIAPKINKQLLHDAVVMYLANLRVGSKRTKPRGEVSGSTKKLYRQKGTGNARVGSRRAPQRRGGGHAMHLEPRSFHYRLNKKAVRAATKMAIAAKLISGRVVVIDELNFDAPRSKELAQVLKVLGLSGVATLVATKETSKAVYLSGRNIPGVSVSPVAGLNALAIVRPQRLLVTREALELIKAGASEAAA